MDPTMRLTKDTLSGHRFLKHHQLFLCLESFFVSDGYCNSRVLKDGTFLMSFGKRNVQFGGSSSCCDI
ncbi:peptidyl-glycine alpha-amidating monooxygenase B isoform X1 [Biomphalaria glabrata]|nr:peptidyl-glycine alpha-amidating monooxygenase B isoform X1 [Biomphalaria glabrata]